MAVSRSLSAHALPFLGGVVLGLAVAGCQSMAAPLDDLSVDDSNSPYSVAMSSYCTAQTRDAVIWGTLPSAWCTPYGPSLYWSRPAPGYPYYGWGTRRPWKGSPGYYSWGHPGRYRYGGFRSGGFRSGGGRR